MRPCFAPPLVLAALLAPALACTVDLGHTYNDTTGSTSATTDLMTSGPDMCNDNGSCEPAGGETPKNCPMDCTCGNGTKDAGEDCDDGNNAPGDGCNPECRQEATKCDNDGVKEDGEACDDGNLVNIDKCLKTCNLASCGDGFLFEGEEECDAGVDNGNDKACILSCKLASCGDGHVQTGVEECDNGLDNGPEAECTPACKKATCGDSFVQNGEDCDDGNLLDTDKCSDDCRNTTCGDGITQAPNGENVNEACDDGNDIETDECNAQCQPIIHRKVFLSSMTYKGAMGGLIGADAKCQTLADTAQLTGNFQAWLSDSNNSPAKRFDTTFAGVYELPNGTLVAQGWMGLTTADLPHAIDTTDLNTVIDADTPVWSNTTPAGDKVGADNCGDWKAGGTGAVGVVSTVNPDWTASATSPCGSSYQIYCFEDPK